jgi:UDP-N-acetylmuramoyl-tripeptide--D-alanyl-D-alanine ligase
MTLDAVTLHRALGDHVRGWPSGPLAEARGVRFHSQRVRPGDAFFAFGGAATHGVRYAEDALARGAAFVVSDRPFPGAVLVDDAGAALLALGRVARAAHRGPVVAVTGSAGKTTTKALLSAALDAFASPGNLNTPHALATVLVDAWLANDPARPLVLELGIDRVGEMAELTELVRPTHGLVTLIAEAHLAGLGDLARVAHEKAGVLRAATVAGYAAETAWTQLPPSLRARIHRYRVDAAGVAAVQEGPGASPPIVGRHHVHDGRDWLSTEVDGAAVELELPGPGRALAENALGALRVALDLGVALPNALARLRGARLEEGRLTHHALGPRLLIDDSYNANPASVAAALEVLARAPRPHTLVLGAMLELGAASAERHRDVGVACRALGVDTVWTVGADARPTVETFPGARTFDDVHAAIAAVAELPTVGTLLVKGSRGVGLDALVRHLRAPQERSPQERSPQERSPQERSAQEPVPQEVDA